MKAAKPIYCIYCGNQVDDKGRIQFDEQGVVIGCCQHCFANAELFVKEGRKINPIKEE